MPGNFFDFRAALTLHQAPSEKGSILKGKNLLPQENCLSVSAFIIQACTNVQDDLGLGCLDMLQRHT